VLFWLDQQMSDCSPLAMHCDAMLWEVRRLGDLEWEHVEAGAARKQAHSKGGCVSVAQWSPVPLRTAPCLFLPHTVMPTG
jgi:hypothetical protein